MPIEKTRKGVVLKTESMCLKCSNKHVVYIVIVENIVAGTYSLTYYNFDKLQEMYPSVNFKYVEAYI